MKKFISTIIALCFTVSVIIPRVNVEAASPTYNYGEALQKSIMFYEFQMAGKLPDNIRNNWRGDSCLNDGKDVGLDLTGGWFDAGDHVKFNLPMAYTASMLAWAVYEYKDALEKSGQLPYLMQQIKWASDYFIKCHPSKNVYYYQVGKGDLDHRWWVPAEIIDLQAERPSYKVTSSAPGSTVCAGTAAALAATAVVFKDTDPAYAAECLKHAKELFEFADATKSDDGYIAALNFYTSHSGWADEMSWAGAWIYMAGGEKAYLDKAESYVSGWKKEERVDAIAFKWGHCWDDVHNGAAILLLKLTGKELYKTATEMHLDYWSTGYNGDKIKYTPKGLAHLTAWGVLRHATTTAFLAAVYSDWKDCSPEKSKVYLEFAKKQTDYALGSSGRSYMVGFGENYPKHPHHRTAHSSWLDAANVPKDHRHVLVGALVGGPDPTDAYTDSITDFVTNEVACDYNAGLVGVLAKLYDEYGGDPIPNFKAIEEVTNDELYLEAKVGTSSNGAEVKAFIYNKTGWPARLTKNLSFKYFMDLTEYVSAGKDPAQIKGSVIYAPESTSIKFSEPVLYNSAKNIYYIEVDLTGTKIYPGSTLDHCRELQFMLQPPGGAPWDNTNDYSYNGIKKSTGAVKEIPLYDSKVLVYGVEPDGTVPKPTTKPSGGATPTNTPKPTNSPTPSSSTGHSCKYGDINHDGDINSTDLALLKRFILKIINVFPSPNSGSCDINPADVNDDGLVDSTDMAFIKRRILGIITVFPAENK